VARAVAEVLLDLQKSLEMECYALVWDKWRGSGCEWEGGLAEWGVAEVEGNAVDIVITE